ERVQDPREQVLAGARLAANENGRGRASDAARLMNQANRRGIGGDPRPSDRIRAIDDRGRGSRAGYCFFVRACVLRVLFLRGVEELRGAADRFLVPVAVSSIG